MSLQVCRIERSEAGPESVRHLAVDLSALIKDCFDSCPHVAALLQGADARDALRGCLPCLPRSILLHACQKSAAGAFIRGAALSESLRCSNSNAVIRVRQRPLHEHAHCRLLSCTPSTFVFGLPLSQDTAESGSASGGHRSVGLPPELTCHSLQRLYDAVSKSMEGTLQRVTDMLSQHVVSQHMTRQGESVWAGSLGASAEASASQHTMTPGVYVHASKAVTLSRRALSSAQNRGRDSAAARRVNASCWQLSRDRASSIVRIKASSAVTDFTQRGYRI